MHMCVRVFIMVAYISYFATRISIVFHFLPVAVAVVGVVVVYNSLHFLAVFLLFTAVYYVLIMRLFVLFGNIMKVAQQFWCFATNLIVSQKI